MHAVIIVAQRVILERLAPAVRLSLIGGDQVMVIVLSRERDHVERACAVPVWSQGKRDNNTEV